MKPPLILISALLLLFFGPDNTLVAQSLQKAASVKLSEFPLQDQAVLSAFSVGLQDDFYLADRALHRVLRFAGDGRLLREVGGFGWQAGQFDEPTDIWAENGLDVFVADYNNRRVQRFDRQLNLISETSVFEQEQTLSIGRPEAIFFSDFGELFIAENDQPRLTRVALDGRISQQFGDFDWGNGALQNPISITVDRTEAIFVADQSRESVLQFDYYGNFIAEVTLPADGKTWELAHAAKHLLALDVETGSLLALAQGENAFKPLTILPLNRSERGSTLADISSRGNQVFVLDGVARLIHAFEIRSATRE